MAGGKETPRQKMIGMMYLVLTALLALNVSKAILDAFISIEENIQKANETEYFRGNAKKDELLTVARDESNEQKAQRAKKVLLKIEELDQVTAQRIQEIDQLKLKILDAVGEDLDANGPGNILLSKFNPDQPIVPIKMDLNMVKSQDKYDEPMHIMIGEDIKNPSGEGLKLWENLNQFKVKVCDLIANYTSIDGQKTYSYKAPDIRKFVDQKDLNRQLESSFKAFNVSADDKETLQKIYGNLAKNERSTVHEVKNVHWLGKTFDHSPVVAAIASLSSLQKEILSARADAVSHLFSRVGGGEYTFNKIIALAYGPELVASGEKINVEVLMAAYDSDVNPEVTMNGQPVTDVSMGKGNISIPANTVGDVLLEGTISITNKHGLEKKLPWQKKVKVMKPMGTISIPAFNVLYVGYDNELNASVSGFDETILQGSGVRVEKRGNKWFAYPDKGQRLCSIEIFGKSNVTGTKMSLGKVNYRISRLPKPQLFLGASADGQKIANGVRNLLVKYPPEVPLQAPFEIMEWEMEVVNVPIPSIKGTGDELNTAALNLIRQAPRNQTIDITVKIRDKSNQVQFVKASFKK
ncbi:MAG: hypothetical protein N4A41_11480 [Crocinitomicaceae bacterium]|jgi:hypothetical protein|nr:hypothetical protein [Crocinitomicaceae bacterium]